MGILVVVGLLLVIMPALLYFFGWASTRYTKKAPSWIGFPTPREEPGKARRSEVKAPGNL